MSPIKCSYIHYNACPMFAVAHQIPPTHRKMTYPDVVRYGAALCFIANKEDIDKAVEEFTSLLTRAGLEMPANLKEFIELWGSRLDKDGKLISHAQHSGRLRALTEEEVCTCFYEAIHWWLTDRMGPYESAADLCENNPAVKAIVEAAGIAPRTVTRHIKEIHPWFKYGRLHSKPVLTDEHKQMRVEACTRNMQRTDRELDLVVWGDEKTIVMNSGKVMGWYSSKYEDYYYSAPPPKYKGQIIKLRVSVFVNALLGGVELIYHTGTSGMDFDHSGMAYQVGLSS